MSREMVQEFFGDLMIVVHSATAPSDDEWREYIGALRTADFTKLKTMVFTDGGAPNSAQRDEINVALSGKTSPGAIISDNLLVRGVVTALSWFNPKIKAFKPAHTAAAIEYLAIPAENVPGVWAVAHKLRARLGYPDLKCIAAPPTAGGKKTGPYTPISL